MGPLPGLFRGILGVLDYSSNVRANLLTLLKPYAVQGFRSSHRRSGWCMDALPHSSACGECRALEKTFCSCDKQQGNCPALCRLPTGFARSHDPRGKVTGSSYKTALGT